MFWSKKAEDFHDVGVKDFTERNKETLGEYVDLFKNFDMDIMSLAYDDYHQNFYFLEESDYVAKFVLDMESRIAELKKALES